MEVDSISVARIMQTPVQVKIDHPKVHDLLTVKLHIPAIFFSHTLT